MICPLDLSRINATSPYQVLLSPKGDNYNFFTDSGVQYNISFLPDDTMMKELVYDFVIANVNHKKSYGDKKVRETILTMLQEFFRTNNEVILYICETGDGKQAFRNKLFERWFSNYNKENRFSLYTATVTDEGVVNYAAIILRNDHPFFSAIVKEFVETTTFLNEKPH